MEINVNKLSRDYEKYPLKKNEVPTLEDLNYLYLELNLGAKDLQKYFNRGSSTITRWFKHYNIVKPKDMWIKQTKRNWLEKYGVDNPQKDKQVKQKTQQTNLEKYGNVCAMQNVDIQQNIRKKNKELYGEEFAAKSKIIREKIENTNLRRYGCRSSFGNEDVRSKASRTILKKYGTDNVMKNINVVKKAQQTNLEKYGTKTPSENEFVKQKIVDTRSNFDSQKLQQIQGKTIQTNLEKYGTEYTFQSSEIKDKIIQTNIERYGVPYAIQDKQVQYTRAQNNIEKWGTTNISTSHISPDVLQLLHDKQSLIEYINKCPVKTVRYISEKLGITYSGLQKILYNHNLWDFVDHPKCSYELEINELFNNIFHKNRKVLDGLEIDLYNEEHKFGIEFNGDYWHSTEYKQPNYHQNKSLLAESKGIFLYHIFEHEWLDDRKRLIITSQINNILGKNTNKIGARKCHIKDVDFVTCCNFLQQNHLQGSDHSSVRLGLYVDNELMGMMTFSKPRFNKNYEWELSRLCTKMGMNISGGANRLLHYFINSYKPNSIISYSDISKTRGNIYPVLGFTFKNISRPNYIWKKGEDILTRYVCQKHRLQQFSHLGSTENEIMTNRGYYQLFDCGNKVWTWCD